MGKTLSSTKMWGQVRERISSMLSELKEKNRTELEGLTEEGRTESLSIGNVSFQITAWSKKHKDGRLAVLVDAWRYRFLGISQSAVVGFLMDRNGAVTEMRDEDFWEHGY